MSGLGTKIKEALSGPHSPEAAKGEVDRRTPGSFPTDDIPQPSAETTSSTAPAPDTSATSSSSHHNKLHKPNDPRGWTDSNQGARAHGYTDSGVGLTETGSDNLHTSRGVTAPKDTSTGTQYGSTGASTTREGLGSSATATGLTGTTAHQATGQQQYPETTRQAGSSSATRTQPGESQSTQPGAGTGEALGGAAIAGTAASAHHHDPTKDAEKQTTSPDTTAPYWGDIQHGTGVYNTVTGHGSAEDAQLHHQGHSSSHGTDSPGTTHGTTQQRAFPLGTSSTAAGDDTRQPQESRFREGAVGAGAGAGAGLAAYELQKKHQQHDDMPSLEKDTKHTTSEPTKEKDSKIAGIFHRSSDKHEKEPKREVDDKHKLHKEEKDSKLAGIFHRDRSDEKDAKHEVKEKDKHSRHTDEATAAAAAAYAAHSPTDDKHKHKEHEDSTQPKEKKESKLHALFHRSSKSRDDEPAKEEHHTKKHHEPAAVAATSPSTRDFATSHDPAQQQPRPYSQQEDPATRKGNNYGSGLAAAGAGGAAAYGAYKIGHRDNEKRHDTSRSGSEHQAAATRTQGFAATQGYGSDEEPIATQGYASTHAPATTQGYAAPQQSSHAGYTGSQTGHKDQYNVLPTGTTSGVQTSDTTSPSGYGHRTGSVPQSTRDNTSHPDHSGAKYGAAGAAAAGLGAATYQSHSHDKSRDTTTGIRQIDSTYPPSSAHASSTVAAPTHNTSTAPTGTTHGTTPAAGVASHSPRDAASATHAAPHATTGSSGTGQYNTLSSGTPSGVNIASDDTATGTHGTSQGAGISHHDNHYGTKAAAAGAAGAGTAAYLASRGDAKPTDKDTARQDPVTREVERKSVADQTKTAAGGAPIPPASSGRVIHKCQKCGEDNDISHYFKK